MGDGTGAGANFLSYLYLYFISSNNMSKKTIEGLMQSYEENLRAIEELDFLSDCHEDEVLIEIIGEAIEAVKVNTEMILNELKEENAKSFN